MGEVRKTGEKTFWRSIREHDFAVPAGHTPMELSAELLADLGSPDSELRDRLAYVILGTWVERGLFTPAELRQLAAQASANLEAGIGEAETDSVFLRAFSVLILVEVVAHDRRVRFLTEAELGQLQDAALTYLAAEQDTRGFVAGKGWAHSCAHTADLLRVLAGHPELGAVDLERILKGIREKVAAPTRYPYLAQEEERLVAAVLAVLDRNLVSAAGLTAWAQRLAEQVPWVELFQAGDHAVSHNGKLFVQSLYLALERRQETMPQAGDLLPAMKATLKAVAPRWY